MSEVEEAIYDNALDDIQRGLIDVDCWNVRWEVRESLIIPDITEATIDALEEACNEW